MLAGCLGSDGVEDFSGVQTPSWQPGQSWDYRVSVTGSAGSLEAGLGFQGEEAYSLTLSIEGTAALQDGRSAMIIKQEETHAGGWDHSQLLLIDPEEQELIGRSWDELSCAPDIRWTEPSFYEEPPLPPLQFPLTPGSGWTTTWDMTQWEARAVAEETVTAGGKDHRAIRVEFTPLGPAEDSHHPFVEQGGVDHENRTLTAWYAHAAEQIVKAETSIAITGDFAHEAEMKIELVSHSTQSKDGVHIEDVVTTSNFEPPRLETPHPPPPHPPPMEIVSDVEFPLNTAHEDTQVTFRIQPIFQEAEGEASLQPVPPSDQEWGSDVVWRLYDDTATGPDHGPPDPLQEGRGTTFTADLPTYGDLRLEASFEPGPPSQVQPTGDPACMGPEDTRTLFPFPLDEKYLDIFIEEEFTIESGPLETGRTELATYTLPRSPGLVSVAYTIDGALLPGDDAQVVLINPDGEETLLESGDQAPIDREGNWAIHWDVEGAAGLIATGHTAEVAVLIVEDDSPK